MNQIDALNKLLFVFPQPYYDPNRIAHDCITLFELYPSITPDSTISNSGKILIILTGTLPIHYKGSNYYIPINIELLENYPNSAPIVRVTPTKDMIIPASHPNVDSTGLCYFPYIRQWAPQNNLAHLTKQMQELFSTTPPVRAKPQDNSQLNSNPFLQSSYSNNTYQSNNNNMYYSYSQNQSPSYGSNQYQQNTPSPYINVTDSVLSNPGRPQSLPTSPSQPAYQYPPVQSLPQLQPFQSYNSSQSTQANYGNSYSPRIGGYPAPDDRYLQNQIPIQESNNWGSVSQPIPTISPQFQIKLQEAEKNRLKQEVIQKFIEKATLFQSELQKLSTDVNNLKEINVILQQELKNLNLEKLHLVKTENDVNKQTGILQLWIEAHDQEGPIDLDVATDPTDELFKLGLILESEDLALEDLMYYLDKVYMAGKSSLNLSNYLSTRRKLSMEQFNKRAILLKIKKGE